jgi:hypothetical protein
MIQVPSWLHRAAVAALFSLFLTGPLSAQVLITEQEAALPAAADTGLTFRGVTRGPKIKIVSPAPGAGTVTSPVNLRLQFESFGGSKIDKSSVKASYLKSPTVDLTQRLEKFMDEGGVNMEGAVIPPGEHVIKVDLKDTDSRAGSTSIKINVAK